MLNKFRHTHILSLILHNQCMEIEKYRKKLDNMTQTKLAEILGVSSSTISRYENDEIYPTAPMLIKLSQALNVSIDVLLNNTSNIVDLNKIDENQREAIELILNLPKAKVDKVVGFCQA